MIAKIHQATGLSVRILTGADEARLVLNGVLFGHPNLRSQNILTMDVGGGSTELITGSSVTRQPLLAFELARWLCIKDGWDSLARHFPRLSACGVVCISGLQMR